MVFVISLPTVEENAIKNRIRVVTIIDPESRLANKKVEAVNQLTVKLPTKTIFFNFHE
jgi:hypothetical protein